MPLDRDTNAKLKLFVTAFKDARDRGANEADMVMYLVKFFEEILGYESLKGEISKEVAIKDRYCDLALKLDGTIRILVECKAANLKGLTDKHIEQAENYASRSGLHWVLLTNGIEWKLFHVNFAENDGITHDLAFELQFLDAMEADPASAWEKLSLLARDAVGKGALEEYWNQRKALSPASVVRTLFTQDVMVVLRRELNRLAPARLDIDDVFRALREVLSKEALMEAGDISIKKNRKRRKRIQKTDAVTGEASTAEVDEDNGDDPEAGDSSPPPPEPDTPGKRPA